MKKLNLDRLVPPGIDWGYELKWSAWGLFFALMYSLGFFFKYDNFYQRLFYLEPVGFTKTLYQWAEMPDFVYVLGRSLAGFWLGAASMAAVAYYHYAYHYQGSKSIYLMRRLKTRSELHLRCITLPAAIALIFLMASLIMLLLYFAYYMNITPPEALLPNQWQKIWGAL